MMFHLIFFSIASFLFSDDSYPPFAGKHFIANYIECDLRSLIDLEKLLQVMKEALTTSSARILDQTCYVFPPNELKLIYLLSESHASLHTYPERKACFVDFFTFGNSCSIEKFHEVLQKFLQPKAMDIRVYLRGESIQELPFP